MMDCPSCQAFCPDNARHCPKCGLLLRDISNPLPANVALSLYSSSPGSGAAPLTNGTILQGRYHIERILGAGSFGRVYLATDTQDPNTTKVAIKELLDTQFPSPQDKHEAIAWFKREVSTLLTLDHPSIPDIHGYWTAQTTSGPFYLAMDYIPGKSLDVYLQEAGGRIPWKQVTEWGIALCEVLSYLHDRMPPFVFRDMKLPNVMLDSRTNGPVLIDFGIARQLATVSGTAIGTWGYVPYEQILGKTEPRSDIYALGATLHALLTGRQPDSEYTRLQRSGLDVEVTLRSLFPSVTTLVPEIPPDLAQILQQATAFAVADRFPDARTMARAMHTVLGHMNSTMKSATSSAAMPYSQPVVAGGVNTASKATASTSGTAPSSGVSTQQPRVVVCKQGTGQYTSIAAAIRHEKPGTRIDVRPGRYTETLVIDKDLEIIAAGQVQDVVLESADTSCVTMRTGRALIRGMTIQGWGNLKNNEFNAVDVPQGRLELDHCDLSSDSWACVSSHGRTASLIMRQCMLHDGRHCGVTVSEHGQALVEDCDISSQSKAGALSGEEGDLVIRRCRIHDGGMAGISVSNGGKATIEECDVFGLGMKQQRWS